MLQQPLNHDLLTVVTRFAGRMSEMAQSMGATAPASAFGELSANVKGSADAFAFTLTEDVQVCGTAQQAGAALGQECAGCTAARQHARYGSTSAWLHLCTA